MEQHLELPRTFTAIFCNFSVYLNFKIKSILKVKEMEGDQPIARQEHGGSLGTRDDIADTGKEVTY